MLSVAMGAKMIEKHFTLDRTMKGPDHKASSDPIEFKAYCEKIRLSEKVIGDGMKKVADEERNMRSISRKGVFLKRSLSKGEQVGMDDVFFIRPGTKMNMFEFYQSQEKTLNRDVMEGEALNREDFA